MTRKNHVVTFNNLLQVQSHSKKIKTWKLIFMKKKNIFNSSNLNTKAPMFTWYTYTLMYITEQLSTTVTNFKIFLFLFRANDYFEDKEHECVITPPGAEYRYSQQMTLCWRLYACNYKINSELFINYQWFVFLTVSMFWSLASPKAIGINHRIKMYGLQISFHSQAGQWHATFPWKVLTAI